jgi:hypothetical protein
MKKILLLFWMFLTCVGVTRAQELYASVQVSAQMDQGSDRTIYNTLQTSLYELMNNKQWTKNGRTD